MIQGKEGVLVRLKDEYGFDRPEDVVSPSWEHLAHFESLLSEEPPRRSHADERRGAKIFPAQLLKDAVMAWTVDKQLALGKKVVVIAGTGHLEYGFGVVERLRNVTREEVFLILAKSNESLLWHGDSQRPQGGVEQRKLEDAVYLYDI